MGTWEELLIEWIKAEFPAGWGFVLRDGWYYFDDEEIEAGKNVKVKVEGYAVVISYRLDDKDLLDPNYDLHKVFDEIRAQIEEAQIRFLIRILTPKLF